MNGDYLIGNPNGIPDPFSNSSYNTDFTARGDESFYVYTDEIISTYGQTYWTMMPSVPLPADIVQRFNGKVMAITGFESDQVMQFKGKETSVPINWVYNHHYVFYVKGADSELVPVSMAHQSVPRAKNQEGLVLQARTKVNSCDYPGEENCTIPTSQIFAEGNGGEYRKSYHGFPQGYAQLLASPTDFSIEPMQIDTWNRDKMPNIGDPFVVGPYSKASAAQGYKLGSPYSPLLECPCTDRIYKVINSTYTARVSGKCSPIKEVFSQTECQSAVALLLHVKVVDVKVVDDADLPAGCSFSEQNGKVTATFNKAAVASAAGCGNPTDQHVSGTTHTDVTNITLNVDILHSVATITLTGPDNVWFGVGFGAVNMAALPYAIVVETGGAVSEHKLSNHGPGNVLSASIKIMSSVVKNNVRTIVLSRAQQGQSSDYYSFDLSGSTTIDIITAVGSTPTFSYHFARGPSAISLVNVGAPTCICTSGYSGQICGNALGCGGFDDHGGQSVKGPRCPVDSNYSDLAQLNNPTCTLESYVGGLSCCGHQNVLLDKDQNPWPGQNLTYRLKFRFYFREYKFPTPTTPASHHNLVRFYWQTEAFAGEYDVPKGGNGEMNGLATYNITSHWLVSEMLWNCDPAQSADHCTGGNATAIQLIYAGGHCHAPSCISIELYNADTNELLCKQSTVYGKDSTGPSRFQEIGYVALPPCLWGDEEGLAPRVNLTMGTRLRSIKVNDATVGHTGEMASWQMRGLLIGGSHPSF